MPIDPEIKLAIIEETQKAKSHSIKVFTAISTAIGFVAAVGAYFGITEHIDSNLEDSGLNALVEEAETSLTTMRSIENSSKLIYADLQQNHPVTIESGYCSTNKADSLNSGSGDRREETAITFSRTFQTPPKIVISFSQVDLIDGANHRAKVEALNVTSTGFTCRIKTWSNTRLYSSTAQWIAYGK